MADSPKIIAGPEGFDDVGAVHHENGRVSLHTVDFFPPMVDDPFAYGAIAAANALSDIYASGAAPSVVLNLAGFPKDWDDEILALVFAGAVEKVKEAGAFWVGGHTVHSAEPLFGFSVFGELASAAELLTNSAAQSGDQLFLTKALGTGLVNAAVNKGEVADDIVADAVASMSRLNADFLPAAKACKIRAATDVTGFGLFGHASNLARASQVDLVLYADTLPLLSGVQELAENGGFTGACERGKSALSERVIVDQAIPSWLADLGFEAETSGGILAAVPAQHASEFAECFEGNRSVVQVGEVIEGPGNVHSRMSR